MANNPSSASALPTPSCAAFLQNQIPTTDSACAIPPLSNATAILDRCCKNAPIETYPGDCGYYCLAADQTVGDLIKCMQENGAGYTDVFCRGDQTARATGSVRPKETGTSRTQGPSASRTGEQAAASSTEGAASGLVLGQKGVSKAGMGVLVMLGVSLVAGALL
jgi:hypothetical protein